ncbi:uncharacterized protein [Antedon mediterranea]|uniref:uncharacterized protein isoform X2 n=1 Tax=Antedon mediterranea TaxID=105859 RepID=UPI003AF8B5AD
MATMDMMIGDSFFKTQLSGKQQSDFFTLKSKEPTDIDNPKQQETLKTNMQNTQFIQQSKQQKVTAEESSEKLRSLHSKLHKEADKIRKWKVDIEMDVKYKDRKLSECQQTIESQRKSILELQLQNENLSQKLQLEIDNQHDISQKIESTRSMCNILKDYSNKVEERLALYEHVKDELQLQDKQQMQQCQELEEQFKSLSLEHIDQVNNLKTKLEADDKHHNEVVEQFQAKLKDLDNEMEELSNLCQEKSNMLDILNKKMDERQCALINIQAEKESFQKILAETKCELENRVQEISMLTETIEEIVKEKEKLSSLKSKIEDNLKELQENVVDLGNTITALRSSLEEEEKRNVMLEKNNAALKDEINEENIKYVEETNKLTEELENANSKTQTDKMTIEKYKEEQASLEKKICNTDDKLQEMLTEKGKLLLEIQEFRQDIEMRKIELCSSTKELKDALEREKVSYDKIDSLKKELGKVSIDKSELSSSLAKSREDNNEMKIQLNKEIQEVADLKEIVKSLQISKETTEEKLEAELKKSTELRENISELDTSIHEQVQTNDKLKGEVNKKKGLQSELNAANKQVKALESRKKTLENQLETKTKQVKDLQQETKSLKSKVTFNTKQSASLEKEISTTKDVGEKYRTENEELLEKLSELEELLKEKENIVKCKDDEHNELKTQMEQAIQEHMEAKAKCESDRAAVSNTLIVYKMENDKIILSKHREIEKLEKKVIALMKTKDDELTSLQDDIKELKEESEKVSEDFSNARKQLKRDNNKIEELENQLQKQKNELELKAQHQMDVTKASHSETPKTPKQNWVHPQSPMMADIPATKAYNPRQPVTPRTPRTPITQTLPQGILKQGSSRTKKKRVIFAESDDESSCSDSSTSQLMELEIDHVPQHTKGKKSTTPSQIVAPLRVRPSSKTPTNDAFDEMKKNVLKLVPRGKANTPQRKVKLPNGTEEENQFYKLYPELHENETETKTTQKKASASKGCLRKAPNKSHVIKGFGDGKPKAKKKKKSTVDTVNDDIPWFDSDSVFGFFDE